MKIKLLVDLPITKEEGCFKGNVYTVVEEETRQRSRTEHKYWFVGKTGGKCAAFDREVEVIEDEV